MTRAAPIIALMLTTTILGCTPNDNPGYLDGFLDTGAWDVPFDTAGDMGIDTFSDVPVDVPDIDDEEDCVQDIDIVFVIDVSTSMSWVLGRLRDEIAAVWSYAETISDDPDYDPQFGLVVFVDDVQVTNSGAAYASSTDLQDEFEYWRGFCSSNAQPGGSSCTNSDCPENSLDALAAAAESYAWREDALHVVIFATDDTFKENPAGLCSYISPSITVQNTYTQTVVKLIDNEVRVGTFAQHNGICSMANAEAGFFTPWSGQPSIPDQTGSQVWDLSQVQSGAISLTEAISGFVLEEWCTDYLI